MTSEQLRTLSVIHIYADKEGLDTREIVRLLGYPATYDAENARLKRLKDRGYVQSRGRVLNGIGRQFWTLTDDGRKAFE